MEQARPTGVVRTADPTLKVIRLLDDRPFDGPANMARDEALLTRVGAGDSPPTLRLYQWDPPTISLGYFQRYADFESLPSPAGDLSVVRRMTGGGAILHDIELTYSLAVPLDHPLVAPNPIRLYEVAHKAIMSCLHGLGLDAERCGLSDDSGAAKGPFFCFARRHRFDVLIGRDKIAGSAQRRTRRAVLQHGSIILANRCDQQPTAQAPLPYGEAVSRLRNAMPIKFSEVTGFSIGPGEWSSDERADVESLIPKYAGDEWTKRT